MYRKRDYHLAEEINETYDGEVIDDDELTLLYPWVIENINLSKECHNFSENCFAKTKPQELDDVGML